MKKLILLLLCTATLGLASCKKDPIIPGNPNRTYNFTIAPNEWKPSQDGKTFTATVYTNYIQPITVDDDGVLLYATHPANPTSYVQIPYTFNQLAYSYELFDGGFAIDIQNTDLQDVRAIKPTTNTLVKLVVIESLYGGD